MEATLNMQHFSASAMKPYQTLADNLSRSAAIAQTALAEIQRLEARHKLKPLNHRESLRIRRMASTLDQLDALFSWDVNFNELPKVVAA